MLYTESDPGSTSAHMVSSSPKSFIHKKVGIMPPEKYMVNTQAAITYLPPLQSLRERG